MKSENAPKNVCVVTGSRAEFGVLRHTLHAIEASDKLNLQLVVTGMHLSKQFGNTIDEILEAGFTPADRVEMLLASDTGAGMGKSIGVGIIGFVDSFIRLAPDIVLLIADRFETFAAACAAMSLGIPLAHISGGELTEGAIDEQMRHAITKMSHIHFVGLPEDGDRVRQMGEEPWRVHVVGGPWMDNIRTLPRISKDQLRKSHGLSFRAPCILVTYHPVTLEAADTSWHIQALLDALDECQGEIIFTYPNADAGGATIIEAIEKFLKTHDNAKAFRSLGSTVYLNLLGLVDLVVGNSSSAMLESQSFKVPVVNIGDRQKGRPVTQNIICCRENKDEIAAAIRQALDPAFRRAIITMKNPYDPPGPGKVADRIVHILERLPDRNRLLRKKFHLSHPV